MIKTDGNIVIAIDVDDKEVDQARKGVKGLGDDAKGVKPGADQASKGIKEISTSLALVKIGAAAFGILAKSMDAAISRFDTFNTFPKVMSALGESTEDSDRAINKLSDGIDGLPTKLDDIVTVTQRMYASFGNLDESTDTALALNNALLASGASAADASRGTDQYIQGLQKGKFELEEWKTLQETMTIGLNQIAQSFGMTERQLKAALDSGEISMDQFNDRMIELGTGTGALADLAKQNSQTIATAFTNLRNTASRGLADIIQAFSDMTEEVTGKSLYDNLESLKTVVNSAFKAISNTIRSLAPLVIMLADGFGYLTVTVDKLSPVILGLVAAYTALKIIQTGKKWIDDSRQAFELMSGTIAKITTLTNAKSVAELANSGVQAKYLAANLASMKALTAKNIVIGILTGSLKLSTAASLLAAKAGTLLNAAMSAITWPVAIVGLAVTALVGFVKYLNRSTEEGERLALQTEALGESTSELTGEIDSNAASYEKQVRRTEASAEANIDLANTIGELSSQESLNAKQKKELQENIELLNNEVEGLNIAYDEEAKALNMSSEEMQKRIELMAEEEKYNVAKERQLEITKEQHEVDMQLKDVIALRELAQEQLNDGDITNKKYRDTVAELDEQEKELTETLQLLAIQYGTTEEAMKEAMENQHEVAKTITGEQIILYESLSDSLKQTVDDMADSYGTLQDAATDAYTKLDTETEHTMASMIETLEHNQEVVAAWGQNQATLMDRAGKEGHENLIPHIEQMGIDQAAELALMANSSETELAAYAEALGVGGETGKDAFLKAHNMSEEDFEAVKHLVAGVETSIREKIEEADFASIGGDVAKGLAKGVEDESKQAMTAAGEMADDMTMKTKDTLMIQSPSKVFENIGKDVTGGMALGITRDTSTVLNALKRLALQMPPIFDHMPGQFTQIGQQVMWGFGVGIDSGRGAVLSKARGIANSVASTMRQALDIHSPSRVMRSIGAYTTLGFTEGMASKKDEADRISQGMADSIIKTAENMNKEIKATTKAANAERAEIEKRSLEDINKIRDKARKDNRKLTKEENIQIRRLTEDKAKKIKKVEEGLANDIIKIEENKLKRVEEIKKNQFEVSKKWIDREKYYNRLSLVDELAAWERVQARYVAGSGERIEADRQVYRMKNEIHEELVSINDSYLSKVKSVNDQLIADEQRLNDEYEKSVDDRARSLYSFAGIFDEITIASDVSGRQLLENLASQVVAMEDWATSMQQLSAKGVDEGLIAELEAMGPKAIAEIQALNTLTELELGAYEELWQQKSELARTKAIEELEPMKDEIASQIVGAREAAGAELDILEAEWSQQINNIVEITSSTLSSLEGIGAAAGQGLLAGLSSIEGPLMAKAQAIATGIKTTMESALGIQSPSREMMEVGQNVGDGLVVGITNSTARVASAASDLAQSIKDSVRDRLYNPVEDVMTEPDTSYEDALKEQFDREKKYVDRLKKYKQLSLADELKMYENYIKDYEKGSDQRIYYEDKIADTKEAIHNKLMSLNDTYIKKMEDASKREKETEERLLEDHERRSTNIKERSATQELAINEEYADKILRLKEESLQKEQDLWDNYTSAVKSREQEIYGSFGLFDQVKVGRISGERLIMNLETQTKALQEWRDDLTTLEGRGIDEALLEELQALGPGAAGEIKALAKLSDGELNQYTDLWQEKTNLARNQAEKEMSGMRQDTINQINQLRSETASQLDIYQEEWDTTISQLRQDTTEEMDLLKDELVETVTDLRLDTAMELNAYKKEWEDSISKIKNGTEGEFNAMVEEMPAIGANAIQGMMDGLSEMTPALMAQVNRIANSIKATIQSALDINSPSGVMRKEVGRWIPEGIALGIKDYAHIAEREATRLSNQLMIATPEQALGTSRMRYSGGLAGNVSNSSVSTDKSKKMENNVNIHTYDSGAKEMERTLRRLQFGW